MTTAISRTCFGVTLEFDPSTPKAASLARAFDVLNQSFAAAIDGARDRVQADMGRQVTYKSPVSPLQPATLSPAAAVGLSLLDDCGLPFVNQFGPFFKNLHSEVSADTLPFVGFGSASRYGRDTLAPLWSPHELITIAIGNTFLTGYYRQINYLTRLNPTDDIWQGAGPQRWFTQFATALKSYLSDLFAGQFVDRNGTAVSFNLDNLSAASTSLDPKQISPQLAGGIVSALVEFLGDQLFQVPFYSGEILLTYREKRDDAGTVLGINAGLNKLTDAVKSATISADDALVLLDIPKATGGGNLPVVFDRISQAGNETPVVRSAVARMIVAKIAQLDIALMRELASAASATDAVNEITNKSSALQTRFTCFKAGVITSNLECRFVVDGNSGQVHGDCTGQKDAGRSIAETGDNFDYADLVGRLVSFGGTTAEKSVRSTVGGLVRGVAIASLQNEVIAEVVASLAGGLSRKFVESATFTGITNYIQGRNGVDATVKQESLKMLAKSLGLISG